MKTYTCPCGQMMMGGPASKYCPECSAKMIALRQVAQRRFVRNLEIVRRVFMTNHEGRMLFGEYIPQWDIKSRRMVVFVKEITNGYYLERIKSDIAWMKRNTF